jgi:hypothetical protein
MAVARQRLLGRDTVTVTVVPGAFVAEVTDTEEKR